MSARARVAATNDDRHVATRGSLLPRRGLRREEAALYIGVSPSKFDAMVAAKEMPQARTFGGVRVWDIRELDLAFDGLGSHDEGLNPWD